MLEQRVKRPFIAPIFIPNQGCPHRCVFCHQERITDQPTRAVNGRSVKAILDQALGSTGFDVNGEPEVAFYGGTFTRLPFERMKELLEAVAPYLRRGLFKSIRISTRPDEIDEERLDFLKNYGVSTVELGAQSLDDQVLELSKRGHSARDTVKSAQLSMEHGMKVGIQLMPGLPGDSEDTFMKTVDKVIQIRPHMVRLYPCIVIRGTELAEWYEEGRYRPLGLEEAVRICRESCFQLETRGIPVIRIGLMSSPSLLQQGQIVAGPWHESFGFLVRSGIYLKKIESVLPRPGEATRIVLRVHPRDIPLVRGHKNQGLRLIENKTGARIARVVADDSLPSGQISVDES